MKHILVVSQIHAQKLLFSTCILEQLLEFWVICIFRNGEILFGESKLRLVQLREHDTSLFREARIHYRNHIKHFLTKLNLPFFERAGEWRELIRGVVSEDLSQFHFYVNQDVMLRVEPS